MLCQKIRHPSCPVRPIAPQESLLVSYGDSASPKKSSSLTLRFRVNRLGAKQINFLDCLRVFRVKLGRPSTPSIVKKTLTRSIQKKTGMMVCLGDSNTFRTTMPFRPRKPSTRATRRNQLDVLSRPYLLKKGKKMRSRSTEQRESQLASSYGHLNLKFCE